MSSSKDNSNKSQASQSPAPVSRFSALTSPNVNDPIYARAKLISKAFEPEIIEHYKTKKAEYGLGVLFINCVDLKLDDIDMSSNEPQMKDIEMAYQAFFNIKNGELQLYMAKDKDIGNKAYYALIFKHSTFYFDKKINKDK